MGIKTKLKKAQELTKKYAKGEFLYPPIPIEKIISSQKSYPQVWVDKIKKLIIMKV